MGPPPHNSRTATQSLLFRNRALYVLDIRAPGDRAGRYGRWRLHPLYEPLSPPIVAQWARAGYAVNVFRVVEAAHGPDWVLLGKFRRLHFSYRRPTIPEFEEPALRPYLREGAPPGPAA